MMATMHLLLLLAALVLLPPAAMLFLECLAALPGTPRARVVGDKCPRVAVLIPAHDEAAGIGDMLQALLPELPPGARVVVVADNCTDATAQIAATFGVTVIERSDPEHIGKGFALAYGKDFLERDPPDVVIFLDADCVIVPGGLDHLARLAHARARPVQAVYVLYPRSPTSPRQALSAFAFRVKNLVRPAGLARLGLPCFLSGSGMALPWDAVRYVPLASGKLVEDYWLTVELVCRNRAPSFDADALVMGQMPSTAPGARAQHTRWEHGHLETIMHAAPRLATAAWQTRRLTPLWVLLDLAVPPLSLLATVWGGVFVLSLGVSWLGFSGAALAFSIVDGALLAAAVVAAWWKYGRGDIGFAALFAAPAYALSKLPLYFRFLMRRKTVWERAERQVRTPDVEQLAYDDRT